MIVVIKTSFAKILKKIDQLKYIPGLSRICLKNGLFIFTRSSAIFNQVEYSWIYKPNLIILTNLSS